MRPTKTLMQIDETEEKRPKVLKSVSDYFSDMNIDGIKNSTKGVFAYEVVLMFNDEDFDDIDEYESLVDSQLSESISDDGGLKNKKRLDVDPDQILLESVETDQIGYEVQSKFYFPRKFSEEVLPSRGMGDVLEHAVREYIKSPFTDRLHRVKTKKEVLEFVENDVEPRTKLASDWIDELELESDIEDDKEWYRSDDVSIDSLVEKGHTISNKEYEAKVEALRTAVYNSNKSVHEFDLEELVKDCFNVTSESTIQKYLSDADLIVLMDLFENPYEHAKSSKETTMSDISGSTIEHKIKNMSVSEFADVNPDLQNMNANMDVRTVYNALLDSYTTDYTLDEDVKLNNHRNPDRVRSVTEEYTLMMMEEIVQLVVDASFDPADYLGVPEEYVVYDTDQPDF